MVERIAIVRIIHHECSQSTSLRTPQIRKDPGFRLGNWGHDEAGPDNRSAQQPANGCLLLSHHRVAIGVPRRYLRGRLHLARGHPVLRLLSSATVWDPQYRRVFGLDFTGDFPDGLVVH